MTSPYHRKQSCPCTKREFVKLKAAAGGNKITSRCTDCGSETTTLEPYRKPKPAPKKRRKVVHPQRHLGVLPLPEPKPKPEPSGRSARKRFTQGSASKTGGRVL